MTDICYENCGYWCSPENNEWADPRKAPRKRDLHCRIEWFADDPLRTCWLIGEATRGNKHSVQCLEYGATGFQGLFRPMESDDPNAKWSKISIKDAYINYSMDARGGYIKQLFSHIGLLERGDLNRKIKRDDASAAFLADMISDFAGDTQCSQRELMKRWDKAH